MASHLKSAKSRKGKGGGGGVTAVPRAMRGDVLATHRTALPRSMRLVLGYTGTAIFSVPAAYFSDDNVIAINNSYSPDASIFSSSTIGYAKLMEFYTKAFVLNSRLRVTFATTNHVDEFGHFLTPVTVGMTVSTSAVSFTTSFAAIAGGLCKWDILGTGHGVKTFSTTIDIGKFLNIPSLLSEDSTASTSSSSPTNLVYVHFWHDNRTNDNCELQITLDLEQDVVLTDPKSLTV